MTEEEKDEATWRPVYLRLMSVNIEAKSQLTDLQRSNQKLSVGRAEEEEGKEKYSPSPSSIQPSWKGRFLMLKKAHEEVKIHLSRARELNERLRNAIARAEQTETEEYPPKQRKIADNLITNHPASSDTAKRLCQVIPVACIVLPSNIAYTQQITTVCGCLDNNDDDDKEEIRMDNGDKINEDATAVPPKKQRYRRLLPNSQRHMRKTGITDGKNGIEEEDEEGGRGVEEDSKKAMQITDGNVERKKRKRKRKKKKSKKKRKNSDEDGGDSSGDESSSSSSSSSASDSEASPLSSDQDHFVHDFGPNLCGLSLGPGSYDDDDTVRKGFYVTAEHAKGYNRKFLGAKVLRIGGHVLQNCNFSDITQILDSNTEHSLRFHFQRSKGDMISKDIIEEATSQWDAQYGKLSNVFHETGHSDMTRVGSKEKYDGLSEWTMQQKDSRSERSLSRSKVNRLNELEFVWGYPDRCWDSLYNQFLAFYKTNGCCDPLLTSWVQEEQGAYISNTMSYEQMDAWNEIGDEDKFNFSECLAAAAAAAAAAITKKKQEEQVAKTKAATAAAQKIKKDRDEAKRKVDAALQKKQQEEKEAADAAAKVAAAAAAKAKKEEAAAKEPTNEDAHVHTDPLSPPAQAPAVGLAAPAPLKKRDEERTKAAATLKKKQQEKEATAAVADVAAKVLAGGKKEKEERQRLEKEQKKHQAVTVVAAAKEGQEGVVFSDDEHQAFYSSISTDGSENDRHSYDATDSDASLKGHRNRDLCIDQALGVDAFTSNNGKDDNENGSCDNGNFDGDDNSNNKSREEKAHGVLGDNPSSEEKEEDVVSALLSMKDDVRTGSQNRKGDIDQEEDKDANSNARDKVVSTPLSTKDGVRTRSQLQKNKFDTPSLDGGGDDKTETETETEKDDTDDDDHSLRRSKRVQELGSVDQEEDKDAGSDDIYDSDSSSYAVNDDDDDDDDDDDEDYNLEEGGLEEELEGLVEEQVEGEKQNKQGIGMMMEDIQKIKSVVVSILANPIVDDGDTETSESIRSRVCSQFSVDSSSLKRTHVCQLDRIINQVMHPRREKPLAAIVYYNAIKIFKKLPTKTQHKPFLRSPLSGDLLDESKSQVFSRYVGKYDRGELDYLADPQPPPPPPNVAAKEAAISESDALTRALQVFNKYTMKYIEAKGTQEIEHYKKMSENFHGRLMKH